MACERSFWSGTATVAVSVELRAGINDLKSFTIVSRGDRCCI